MHESDGFLIVDKPRGVASFSMVSLVRRLSGIRRVGHAGTLDPLASGVLPVAVGRATRLIEYLDDASKTYLATVRLGVVTDTADAEGQVVAQGDPSGVTVDAVRALLPAFSGDIEQVPPRFSAIKVAGKPLYRYAREGADVIVAPRRVRVERIELTRFEGDSFDLEVECGKGTYIRSLAHDIGARLGCGAHLAALVRTASGGFTLVEAHSPEALELAAGAGVLHDLMLAPDRAVERRPAAILDIGHAAEVTAGRDISFQASRRVPICRAYSTDGDFLGVLQPTLEGAWHPVKVLIRP
jgi:tRNA pseudouridine55 synthase